MRRIVRLAAVAGLLALAPAAWPQGHTTRDGRLAPKLKNLGDLQFAVSTKSKIAQSFVNQGLTLVYGFNHGEAVRSFREAARIDPRCAMAYWGQALALAPNINDSAIGPDREQQGHAAAAEAVKRRPRANAKERALIDAIAARFSSTSADREALNAAYARAMTKAHAAFPNDPDVATLYADAVMNTMPWDYWQKGGAPKPGIGEVRVALERTLRAHPNHPGANHFYIHLMEASDEVDAAVPAADRLGALVPGAGHLVHMPGHVYMRVGRYSDAVEANIKAIAADEDYITQCRVQGIYPATYYPHNIHFMHAALAMEGRGADALEAARKVATRHDHAMMQEPVLGLALLLKTMPALTMVRFGEWEAILAEPEPEHDQAFVSAMRHFARGFAFSATGKPTEAGAELERLRALAADPSLKDIRVFGLNPLSSMGTIAVAMLEGDIAEKAGDGDAAAAAFRRAVAAEDSLLYSEPPDWPLPPRQYLAHTLLAAGRPADAERVYREDLNRHRANGWSLAGLGKALRAQGKENDASEADRLFTKAWARADVKLSGSRF